MKKIILSFYLTLALSLSLLGYIIYYELDHQLQFIVFDIGQGDAMLIKTPSGVNILIDGGPDNTLVYKLGRYLPYYDRQIDLMILSHPHDDHLVGLLEVIKRYRVKNVLFTGVNDSLVIYQSWLSLVDDKKIRKIFAGEIKMVEIDQDSLLTIFYPSQSSVGKIFSDLNEDSIVARFKNSSGSILLTGDAPKSVEEKILADDLKSDVLKIGHHGSNTSSGKDFLVQVEPRLAVISLGENKFGHPSAAVLSRLAELEVPYFITHQVGDITVTFTDGKLLINNIEKL